jgi:hypothetical protein
LSGDTGIAGDISDNAYTVVYMDHPDSLTVLDGFTVRDGNARYAVFLFDYLNPRVSGGGLFIEAMAAPDFLSRMCCPVTIRPSSRITMVAAAYKP